MDFTTDDLHKQCSVARATDLGDARWWLARPIAQMNLGWGDERQAEEPYPASPTRRRSPPAMRTARPSLRSGARPPQMPTAKWARKLGRRSAVLELRFFLEHLGRDGVGQVVLRNASEAEPPDDPLPSSPQCRFGRDLRFGSPRHSGEVVCRSADVQSRRAFSAPRS